MRPKRQAALLVLAVLCCSTCASTGRSHGEGGRCYPYLPEASGVCRTQCTSIDHFAGSRGPADFAKNGWPLDCIGGECVPLPPEAVDLN